MRIGMMVVLAVLTTWAGGWAIASFQLNDRVSKTAIDARGLCSSQRGGGAVTTEALAERFAEIAADNGLSASDVQVTVQAVQGGSATAQIAGSLSKMTKGKLKMTANEVAVSARVYAKKWMWSVDQEISASCMLHGAVKRSAR